MREGAAAGCGEDSNKDDWLLKEVKPLLDKRCTVCHSCYNSPCQLKLDSFEGADRGATKRAVYNASRLSSMDPTRLFTDAQTTDEWRKKDFFSVTDSSVAEGLNDSIMIQPLRKAVSEQTDQYLEDQEITRPLQQLVDYDIMDQRSGRRR